MSLQAPTEYVPGGVYDLKVTVDGPAALPSPAGMNTGGFALQVSSGSLSGGANVKAELEFATHTAAGNNQRSWDLKWTAPAKETEVTFWLSANAVNGDQASNQLDRWNKVAPIAKAKVVNTNTSAPPETDGGGDSSFLPVGAALLVIALVAVVRRRV